MSLNREEALIAVTDFSHQLGMSETDREIAANLAGDAIDFVIHRAQLNYGGKCDDPIRVIGATFALVLKCWELRHQSGTST